MTGPFSRPAAPGAKPARKAGRRKAGPVICQECREFWDSWYYASGSHKNGGGTPGVAVAWEQVQEGLHPSRPGGGTCSTAKAATKALITGRALISQRLSEITLQASDWLWLEGDEAYWVAAVGLTLLGGREGVGKSTVAFDLAAKVTRGELPGDLKGQPRDVIVVAGEDSWAHTIGPRMVAAGVEADRVHRVACIDAAGLEGLVSLPADMAELAAICRTHDVALIILDPLMSVIDGKLDTHKDRSVRQALDPLARLAHDAELAIIGLIHVNKSQGVDVLTSLMASRAFAAVARGVLFAAEVVPEVGEEDSTDTFMLGQPKNNLAAKVAYTLTYRVETAKVGYDRDRDKDIVASKIAWVGRLDRRVHDILAEQQRPASKRETAGGKCAEWLEAHLREFGPTTKKALIELAGVRGFPQRMLERAGQKLGVQSRNLDGSNATVWAHPEELDQPAPLQKHDVLVVNDVVDVLVVDVAHD